MMIRDKKAALVKEIIMDYPVGDPIFSRNVAWTVSEATGLPLKKSAVYVSATLRRLMDRGIKLKRFYRGVYYRYEECSFGETPLNKNKLITEKYLKNDTGYETGPAILNSLGFTTLMSNDQRTFVSNAASKRSFVDKNLNIRILKPKVILSEHNIRYFEFLDLLKLLDEIPIDNQQPELKLAKIIFIYNLYPENLVTYAQYYGKKVLKAVYDLQKKGIAK